MDVEDPPPGFQFKLLGRLTQDVAGAIDEPLQAFNPVAQAVQEGLDTFRGSHVDSAERVPSRDGEFPFKLLGGALGAGLVEVSRDDSPSAAGKLACGLGSDALGAARYEHCLKRHSHILLSNVA